jgi:hypothetical protein
MVEERAKTKEDRMSKKREGDHSGQWAKHLKKYGKRASARAVRRFAKNSIRKEVS